MIRLQKSKKTASSKTSS